MSTSEIGFVRNFMLLSLSFIRLYKLLLRKELMSWITWVAILVAWPLLGLAVAYLFGSFTRRGEDYGNAVELSAPVVSYLRPAKRARVASRAAAQPRTRSQAVAGRRAH